MLCHGQNVKETWVVGAIAFFIRWVTVLFAPTIASLREGGGFCEAKDGRRERNKRLSIVIFRALSFVCGRGGEASDIFCAALSLSHLRCQLSPGESLGLSVLFVRCVTILFAGIVHCTREGRPLPYGRSAHSVGNRIISRFVVFSAGASPRPTDCVKNRSFGG